LNWPFVFLLQMIYGKLKKLAKTLLPKKFLLQLEPYLRRPVYWFYKGNNYQCPVCEKKLKKFIQLETGDKLCPYCGSIDRHRRLWTLLQPQLVKGTQLLDFSPPGCLYRKLVRYPHIKYLPTDFAAEFLASQSMDITQLNLPDNSFDLIICYHILEHVEEDTKALNELYRVLKPSGTCIIQTPFKEGQIYEDLSIKTTEERKKHFDQEDHVRIYSVEGLSKRLSVAGFSVEPVWFSEKENNYLGFHQKETILFARK
jgi:SAM-dependent methyltransferase